MIEKFVAKVPARIWEEGRPPRLRVWEGDYNVAAWVRITGATGPIELRITYSDEAGDHHALVDAAEADRGLDLLRSRAVTILTRIAAGRGLGAVRLHLVIEQSDLWRVPPLTYVSVQSEDGPTVLRLDEREKALIRETLFAAPLTEADLHRINIAQATPLRDIVLEPGRVSAHARMAALMAQVQDKAEAGVGRG